MYDEDPSLNKVLHGKGSNLDFWLDWWVGDKPLGLEIDIEVPEDFLNAKVSDFITNNKGWDFDKLQVILSEKKVNEIRKISIPIDSNAQDTIFWPGSPSGIFSVSFAYAIIAGSEDYE